MSEPGFYVEQIAIALRPRRRVVALEREGAILVTADDRYWRLARHHGQVIRLGDWRTQTAEQSCV